MSKGCAAARVENYICFIIRLLVIWQVVLWLPIKVHPPALYRRKPSSFNIEPTRYGALGLFTVHKNEKGFMIYFTVHNKNSLGNIIRITEYNKPNHGRTREKLMHVVHTINLFKLFFIFKSSYLLHKSQYSPRFILSLWHKKNTNTYTHSNI